MYLENINIYFKYIVDFIDNILNVIVFELRLEYCFCFLIVRLNLRSYLFR